MNDRQMSDHQINSGMSQSSEHNAGQASHTPESGGWQKFPSSADHGSTRAAVQITVQWLITVQALEFPPQTALTMRRKATLAETAGLRWICIGLS